jgi:hypothetical protein
MVNKLKIGDYYYYAKSSVRFMCVEIEKDTSNFVDNNNIKYIFYNEDIYNSMYGLIENRKKKIKKIYENMVD